VTGVTRYVMWQAVNYMNVKVANSVEGRLYGFMI